MHRSTFCTCSDRVTSVKLLNECGTNSQEKVEQLEIRRTIKEMIAVEDYVNST